MKFKIGLILLTLFAFTERLKAQDSLSISSIDIVQLDSGDFQPFFTDIPFIYLENLKFIGICKNNSQDTISDLKVSVKFIAIDSLDSARLHLSKNILVSDTLLPNSKITVKIDTGFGFLCRGNYTFRLIIESPSNGYVDSSENYFNISDSTLSKDFSDYTSITGSSLYADTINGIFGGDTTGDRFGTLFQFIDDSTYADKLCLYCKKPTSLSLFIANDTNNIGISLKPNIWAYNEDSIGTKKEVGKLLYSSFHSTQIDSNDLGRWISFGFDIGPLLSKHFTNGQKFVAGWETTSRLRINNNLSVAHDTLALSLQPHKSSFVYFGHLPSHGWMAVHDLPAIRLNFDYIFIPKPCSYIVSVEENLKVPESKTTLYPNPVKEYFILESIAEKIQSFQLFNSLGQQFPINYLPTPEGYRFDAAHLPKGLYVLHTSFSDGFVSNQKFIKTE